jgi:glycosyltransferase involved in cell wall biosynthesis
MFPGAPRPHKGVEDVLEALDRLNQPDLRLVMIGGSPYDDYDDRLKQKWGRWLIQLPRLPVEKMPEIVSAAHVVVVPQRDTLTARAQFPLKLTDGMAMAKPVLSTRIGDIPDILAETGFLVDPDAPEQLAEQIDWIFQNFDQASDRSFQARKRCVEHYSVKAMVPILSEVLAQLR